MRVLDRKLGVVALCLVTLSGCASEDTVRLMREPGMPPVAVALAPDGGQFYRNVSIQEVYGAPEFRWFDGDAIITTRPTRKDVVEELSDHLNSARMLAPSRLDSDYMLYVNFDELHGPDVWIFSDKLASARVHFRLVRWRTGEVVREQMIEASYRVKSGITPEVGRQVAGLAVVAASGGAGGAAGGAVGAAIRGASIINEARVGAITGAITSERLDLALIAGQTIRYDWAPNFGYYVNDMLRADIGGRDHFNGFEAMMAGGAFSSVGQGTVEVVPAAYPYSGTRLRNAATSGLVDMLLDEFLTGLSRDGSIIFKKAVSCASLNPGAVRIFPLIETPDAVGIDCQGTQYWASPTHGVAPSRF